MDNKKWTDSDLKTAFEDGCKFVDFADLQDFLLKRRQLAASTESNCIKPAVTSSVRPKCQKPEDYHCVKLYGGCCRDLNCEHWR